MNVLIYGASNAISISIARLVHSLGHCPFMADTNKYSRGFYSRFCSGKYIFRNPSEDAAGFASDVAKCISGANIELVLPTTDEALLGLVAAKEVIPDNVRLPFPMDSDKINYALDKGNLPEICREAGVRTPTTFKAGVEWKVSDIFELKAPYALKRNTGVSGKGFVKVESKEDLVHVLEKIRSAYPAERYLLQEFITGQVYGVGGIFEHGTLGSVYSYRYVRRYPVLCGPPTVCMMEHMDSLRDAMQRVLSTLRWQGHCQMDFIVEANTGEQYLLDINPVHWYTIPFTTETKHGIISYLLGNVKQAFDDIEPDISPHKTISLSRELQRLIMAGVFGRQIIDDITSYYCYFRNSKYSYFHLDPFPLLLAPFLKILRANKR